MVVHHTVANSVIRENHHNFAPATDNEREMKLTWPYRLTALLLAILAAGHTYIFLTFVPTGTAAKAVLDGMRTVHFDLFGGSLTYNMMYTGFGLIVTSYLVFVAWLAWHLGGLAATAPQSIGMVRWVFFAIQIVVFVLAWIYLAGIPVWLTGAVAVCAGWAAWRVGR